MNAATAVPLAPASPPEAPSNARARLEAAARNGFRQLVEIVPGAVGRGLLGGLKGALLYGFSGLVFALAAGLLTRSRYDLPTWLVTVNVAIAAIALALAGGYASGLKAALGHLAQEMQKRGVVRAIYALIRPTLLKAAKSAEASATPLTQHELTQRLHTSVSTRLSEVEERAGDKTQTLVDRAIGFVARRVQAQLVLGIVAQLVTAKDPKAAAAELEETGVVTVEEALSDFIGDLFSLQTTLALIAALVVSVLPTLLYVLLSAPPEWS